MLTVNHGLADNPWDEAILLPAGFEQLNCRGVHLTGGALLPH